METDEKSKTSPDNTKQVEINEETNNQLKSIILALRGNFKYAEGDQREAYKLYIESLRHNPENLDLFKSLHGFIKDRIGTPSAAYLIKDIKDIYSSIVKNNPQNADALTKLGLMYELEGKTEEAKDLLLQSLNINPDQAMAQLVLGSIEFSQGNKEMGKEYLRESIKTEESSEAMTILSGILMNEGETEEAISLLTKTITDDPRYAAAYYNLGTILSQQGKKEDAGILLLKAIDRAAQYQHIQVAIWAAVNLYNTGAEKEAEEILKNIVKTHPENSEASFRLATLKEEQGETYEAKTLYMKTLELDPNNEEAKDNLAKINEEIIEEQNKPKELTELPAFVCPIRVYPEFGPSYRLG